MKNNRLDVVIEVKELIHTLSLATSVVEKRNIIPELNNIKLTASGNLLEIVATDMDLYLSQTIGAQVLSEGAITVNTKTLLEIVKKITDKEIKLKATRGSHQLELEGQNCQFSLLTLPVDQFPVMTEVKAKSILKISCSNFARIIEYTHFAVSLEETRYNLNGIYLHIKDNKLCAAATDGHRLSVASVAANTESTEFGVILPRKSVEEVLKIVKDSKNSNLDIEISLGVNKIKFVCSNIIMVSKLIDGIFPEYSAFIPQETSSCLTINTKMLEEAIGRIATITVDKFRAIKLALNEERLEITASGEAKGMAKETIFYSQQSENTVCNFTGNEVTIGFNPKYLLDALSSIKENTVEFYINDPFSPVLIKIVDNSNDVFVIMPVKV